MKVAVRLALIVLCSTWVLPSLAYELVEVRRGDSVIVRSGESLVELKLIGVWVPTGGVHYRGHEARVFVDHLLRSEKAYVRPAEGAAADGPLPVQIRVGEDGARDLAVVLAEAGLALSDGASASNASHLVAIREAERDARRAARGMHDGGLQSFNNSTGLTIDLGTLIVARSLLRTSNARYPLAASYSTQSSYSTPSSAAPRHDPYNGIHRSGVEAIRDWGESMGLPPDSSASGR